MSYVEELEREYVEARHKLSQLEKEKPATADCVQDLYERMGDANTRLMDAQEKLQVYNQFRPAQIAFVDKEEKVNKSEAVSNAFWAFMCGGALTYLLFLL